jgi:hypothetical protein
MAFTSISKMTVPLAGATENAQGLLMPKLQYRFRVLFNNIGVDKASTELTKQVIDVTRPQVTFPEIPLEIYNSRVYLAGKPEWQAITLNLRDDATGQVAMRVGEQLQKQFDFSEQASASAGESYKFGTVIQILDGGGGIHTPQVLETWELYGCFIQSANYNTLNYGANEPVTISLTIRYDNAVQTPTDSGQGIQQGVGVAVARAITDNVSGIGG